MNSFISWICGKKLLRDEILARLQPQYDKYIEVFGGAGWVLFRKSQGREMEIYNDFNSNLVNLFRCVSDKPNKLFPRLRDVDRAAKFYQLIRYSYASGLDSFGCQPHSMWADFPQIDMASMRLQKVLIENRDFEKLIKQYDSNGSFFYCDPPYFATENYYKNVGFKTADHVRLRDTLMNISIMRVISLSPEQ